MLAERLAAGGALEGLEAGLALDGEGGGVLRGNRQRIRYTHFKGMRTDFSWLLASPLPPFAAARSRFCCALRGSQYRHAFVRLSFCTWLRYPWRLVASRQLSYSGYFGGSRCESLSVRA